MTARHITPGLTGWTHLEGVRSVTGVEQAVSGAVAHREARPEVGPEDGLVVRGVDVLILVLNVTDPYPVALGGTRNIAVDQFIDLLTTELSVHQDFNSNLDPAL